jgi:hypothetical protein
MKIKIIKCVNKELWYYKFVGLELKAEQLAGGCMARHSVKSEFNNFTISGWIEPGDFEVIK